MRVRSRSSEAHVATLELLSRVAVAAIMGALLGWERDRRLQNAGLRTHTLVASGAALFAIAGMSVAGPTADPTRVAAQVVTGIGFIGAGAIVRSGLSVVGVTTAATLWVAAAVGTTAGLARLDLAVGGTVLITGAMSLLGLLRRSSFYSRTGIRVEVDYRVGHGTLWPLFQTLEAAGGTVVVQRMTQEGTQRSVHLRVTGLDRSAVDAALHALDRTEISRIVIGLAGTGDD